MLKELELGPRQRATVGAAITMVAVVVLLTIFIASIWGLALCIGFFQNVLLPPVVAGILTILLRPYYDWLVKICRGSQAAGLFLFFLFALIPLVLFVWLAGGFVINQLVKLFEDLPSILNKMVEAARSHWPQVAALLEKNGLMP
jgi:predicted PurR-regulated permease PerM